MWRAVGAIEFGVLGGGCAAGRDVRPAAQSLSFAPPKESNQRKGGPAGRVPALRCGQPAMLVRGAALRNSLRACSAPFKQRQRVSSRSAHASLRARPTPCASRHGQKGGKSIRAIAALGPRLGGAAASRGVLLLPLPLGEGRGEGNPSDQVHRGQPPSQPSPSGGRSHTEAERSDGPNSALTPSGCAEARSGWGARMHRRMHSLRALTRCRCLSEENAVNAASPAAPPHDRASQAARRATVSGAAFSLVTFFWRSKRK